jgi:hypothetical protein
MEAIAPAPGSSNEHEQPHSARTFGAGRASLLETRYSRRGRRGRAARFFRQAAGLVGPAARLPRLRTVGWACSVQGIGTGAGLGRGSSEVEHQAHNLGVAGSIPVHNTPQSAGNRLLGDVENVSTWAQGERSAGSVGSRCYWSVPRTRRAGAGDANRRPEARENRRPSPAARERRCGARRGLRAARGRRPKRTRPAGRVGSSAAPRLHA